MSKKDLPNIEALQEFRLKGKVIKKGQVISKKDFGENNTSDWKNICTMHPKPRAKETDAKVGFAKAKGDAAALPGATSKAS